MVVAAPKPTAAKTAFFNTANSFFRFFTFKIQSCEHAQSVLKIKREQTPDAESAGRTVARINRGPTWEGGQRARGESAVRIRWPRGVRKNRTAGKEQTQDLSTRNPACAAPFGRPISFPFASPWRFACTGSRGVFHQRCRQ